MQRYYRWVVSLSAIDFFWKRLYTETKNFEFLKRASSRVMSGRDGLGAPLWSISRAWTEHFNHVTSSGQVGGSRSQTLVSLFRDVEVRRSVVTTTPASTHSLHVYLLRGLRWNTGMPPGPRLRARQWFSSKRFNVFSTYAFQNIFRAVCFTSYFSKRCVVNMEIVKCGTGRGGEGTVQQ